MLKLSKPIVGFFLAVLITSQGLVSPYFSGINTIYKIADSEQRTTVDDLNNYLKGDLLLVKNGIRTLSHTPNIDLGFGEFLTFIIPHFLIQLEQDIKSQISRGLAIILKFGIRDSLYPSHYFW